LAAVYGWTHDQILKLTPRLFFTYLEQASRIEAAQQLLNIEAASYPNMDKTSRRRIDRHYSRIVSPPVPATTEEQRSSWEILRARAPKKARKKKSNGT